jgi:hypothetical protein
LGLEIPIKNKRDLRDDLIDVLSTAAAGGTIP